MKSNLLASCVLALSGVLLAGTAQADFPTVPKETYEALKLDKSASPKQLHEALLKRYLDPAEGFGKGKYGQYWEPLPFSKYLDPCQLLQATDISQGYRDPRAMCEMPHR